MIRYYTSGLFVFSTVGGIVTYLILSGFADTPTCVLFSAITTLLLSITIPATFAIADRKFLPLKREITAPIVLDERVNYVVGQEIKQGFMVTTSESLFVISTDDKKPVKFEIKKSDIKKISITDGIYLNIFLDYDKCIRIFGSNCEELSNKLAEAGFGKN